MTTLPAAPAWGDQISDQDWSVYEPVLRQASEQGIPFALGGAFALAVYTNHLRYTKDMDLYVLPSDRNEMIRVVENCGLRDYYSRLPYDRSWIHRSCYENQIIDVIWGMPNRRTVVDEQWLTRGPALMLRGRRVQILPAEELFWAKLYVMQRDRCDWPDILNILYHSAARIDWEHMMNRIEDDFPLLAAVLTLFRWLCPDRAEKIPGSVWRKVLRAPAAESCASRPHLLDTRPWFGEDFPLWPGK